jgi:hypothetical protein
MPRNPLPGEKHRYLVPLPSEVRERWRSSLMRRGAALLRRGYAMPLSQATRQGWRQRSRGSTSIHCRRLSAGVGLIAHRNRCGRPGQNWLQSWARDRAVYNLPA